jgi:ABC-type lipoprotein export system ATPase subunit
MTTKINASNKTLIEIQEVEKIFHTPAGDFPALKGITVDIHEGEFVSVVGKSGSGKSTLVNMLTGIDHPTAGRVLVQGTPIHALSESERSRWRGRNLGIVFQFYQLLPTLTLLENVLLPMDIADRYNPSEREARAMDLLELVGVAEDAHKMPAAVSGGQQQTTAIARALANDPPIVIADEPTGNLDTRSAEHIYDIFETLKAQGKTIVMVTHDPTLAERTTRTLLLSDGELIDETVAKAFPQLSHPQMLQATKHAEPRRFAPGEEIIHEGARNERVYLIRRGAVEVTLTQKDAPEIIARLGPGQYFGEISLLEPGTAIAGVRAASETPVEVIALAHDLLAQLLEEAQSLREQLHRVVETRRTENKNRRSRRRRRLGVQYA